MENSNDTISSNQIATIKNKLYDPQWRKRLRANPVAVLQEEDGFFMPDGYEVRVVTCTKDIVYYPLGEAPSNLDLGDVQAAGAHCFGSAGTMSCISSYTTTAGTIGTLSSAGSFDPNNQ